MRTSTIVWIIIVLIIIGGIVWWLVGSAQPAAAPQMMQPVATSTSATASSTAPGENLTLGQDSNAKVGSFLIGYNGMTLYTYAKDTAGKSNCSGACATAWPPYVVTTAAGLVGESPLDSTKIGTITRADGSLQVTYGGKPLYFYANDAAAGDTTGEGVGGVWHVAKP